MYLTLTLNPSIDYYIGLPQGKTLLTGTSDAPAVNRSICERFETGGKGINVAKILRRLDAKSGTVIAAGFCAGFTGQEIIRNIELEDIVAKFIEVPGNSRINVKARDGKGIETEINGSGPSVGPGDISRLISVLSETDFDTLFLSGSLPGTVDHDTYAVIMRSVLDGKPDTRIIVDCEGEALMRCLPLKPFLIKPNASELAALTGMKLGTSSPLKDIRNAASKLKEKGAQNVLVSLGGNGAFLFANNGEYYDVPGIKGDVVSTIGAGDTMTASFIYALDRDGDMKKALEFSNACAAMSAFTAGLPDSDSFSRIVKEFS